MPHTNSPSRDISMREKKWNKEHSDEIRDLFEFLKGSLNWHKVPMDHMIDYSDWVNFVKDLS